MACQCHQQHGISGYPVLTIDGLGAPVPAVTAGHDKARHTMSSDKGFRDGYEGRGKAPGSFPTGTAAQKAGWANSYAAAYARGAKVRAGGLSPAEASAAASTDGNPVPGGAPPGGAGKTGGAAKILCTVDSGQGGWREVNGQWLYAHHEGCILSFLAQRYLGDANAWKQIYTASKERGLLPAGSTPDKIPVRDGKGERVLFAMPEAAVARAKADGCIPSGLAGAVGGISTPVLIVGALVLAGGAYLVLRD